MTRAFDGSPDLTDEQRAVVALPVGTKALVTAGAGSGKTHTLVRRLDALLASGEVAAGEVLVLTFSRAAVRELDNRLAQHGEAARHVRARTFDSWALEILLAHDATVDWHSRRFDERITAATDVLAEGKADDWYEDDLVHVVIDEVQDLVGDRRELVQALLDRYDCGFTIVGDAAQAIYGFQVERPEDRSSETGLFLKWLRNTFGDDLDDSHHLTRNFRAKSSEARSALPYGRSLEGLATGRISGPRRTGRSGVLDSTLADGRQIYDALRLTLRDSLNFGNLSTAIAHEALTAYDGSTAILCRTNGQALVISEMLHEGGVRHQLQQSSRARITPAWLAEAFKKDSGSILSRNGMEAILQPFTQDAYHVDQLWSAITRVAGTSGNRAVDLSKLKSAMAAGRLPDELTAPPSSKITVSSIHRAKGLEFDRVIVIPPGPASDPDEADVAEEARLLYVAMTRARDELMRAAIPNTFRLKRCPRTGRWARYGPKEYQRLGMAMAGADVHAGDPAGCRGFAADPLELQDYLRSKVSPGDVVTIERSEQEPGGRGDPPVYGVFHLGRQIGLLSDGFRSDLDLHMKRWSKSVVENWPRAVSGARVEAVETVLGSEASGRIAGLSEYGVWLAPRLTGLTRFTYDINLKGASNDA